MIDAHICLYWGAADAELHLDIEGEATAEDLIEAFTAAIYHMQESLDANPRSAPVRAVH